jgi:7-cyano-7-deazaguanine synthase
MKSLLLLSGGMDSSSAAYILSKMDDVDAMFFNYGQRSFKQQKKAVVKVVKDLEMKLIEVDVKGLGDIFAQGEWMRPHEPIKHRNVVLVSTALTYAAEKGYDEVVLATINEDCEYEPNKATILRDLKILGEAVRVKLSTPFVNLSKAIVLKMGVKNGLDPSITYSCMLGHEKHCGKCSQCEHRKIAFKSANITDPTQYME